MKNQDYASLLIDSIFNGNIYQENSCRCTTIWYNESIRGQRKCRSAYSRKNNREIYKCIADDIRIEEVIITDKRVEHIQERRGKEFYIRYSSSFCEILQEPDYIFKDKREHTALVCKRVVEDGKYVNVVLRIAIEADNPEYKNSIITAIGESEKRFAQRFHSVWETTLHFTKRNSSAIIDIY